MHDKHRFRSSMFWVLNRMRRFSPSFHSFLSLAHMSRPVAAPRPPAPPVAQKSTSSGGGKPGGVSGVTVGGVWRPTPKATPTHAVFTDGEATPASVPPPPAPKQKASGDRPAGPTGPRGGPTPDAAGKLPSLLPLSNLTHFVIVYHVIAVSKKRLAHPAPTAGTAGFATLASDPSPATSRHKCAHSLFVYP